MGLVKSWKRTTGRLRRRFLYNPDGVFRLRRRRELPLLLAAHGLTGEGVEVGVQEARFSGLILERWEGTLYSIDPWREYPKDDYVDGANVSQALQDETCARARERLAPFGERSVILRMTSAEAAPRFGDGQLDFAYLDARHDYDSVAEDIALWRPKVRPGGFLLGHDYLDGELIEGVFGVKRAVDEFVQREGRRLVVTRDNWPTWCVPL